MKLNPYQIQQIKKSLDFYHGMKSILLNAYDMYQKNKNHSDIKDLVKQNLDKHLVTLSCTCNVDKKVLFENLELILGISDDKKHCCVPITVKSNVPFVKVELNGKSFDFVIDTGCSYSQISKITFAQLKSNEVSSSKVFPVKNASGEYDFLKAVDSISHIKIGDLSLAKQGFLLNKSGVNLLGMDILSKMKNLSFDFENSILRFEF